MAGSIEDINSRLVGEFNEIVNAIQTSEPRYKSLARIIDWAFAIGIGTILGVISNSDKFKLIDPRINAAVLAIILFFLGIASFLILYYKIILYLYDRAAVTRIAQFRSLSQLVDRDAARQGYGSFILQKAKELLTDKGLEELTISALNPKREKWIIIPAAVSYSIGLVLYIFYFIYALSVDP